MKQVNSLCIVCLKKFNVCLANDENISSTRDCNNFYVFCQHLYSTLYRNQDEQKTKDKLLLDFYYDSFSFCKSCTKLVDILVKLEKKVDKIVKSLAARIIRTTGDSRRHDGDDDFPKQKILVEQILTDRITQIEEDIYKYYNPQVTLIDFKLRVDDDDEAEDDYNTDPLSLPDDGSLSQVFNTENSETVNSPSSLHPDQDEDDDLEENFNDQKGLSDDEDLVNDINDCQVKEESEECDDQDDDDDDYKPKEDVSNESKSLRTRSNENHGRGLKSETIPAIKASTGVQVREEGQRRKRGRPPTGGRKLKVIKSTSKKSTKTVAPVVATPKILSSESDREDDQDGDNVEGEVDDDDTKDSDWTGQDEIESCSSKKASGTNKLSTTISGYGQRFPTVTIGEGVYRYGEWEFSNLGENVFKCHCGRQMKGRASIYRHINIVHALVKGPKINKNDSSIFYYGGYTCEKVEDGFQCGVCGKVKGKKITLYRHIREFHNISDQPRCEACGIHFVTQASLDQHKCRPIKNRYGKYVHLNGDNYLYDGKWKYQKLTMNLADGSVGVGAYKCGTCGVERKKLDLLSTHIRNHHAEPHKYVCEICGYSTAVKGSFNSHQVTKHSVQHNFVCEICGKACKSRALLYSHKLGHRSERFQCPKCDKSFQYPRGLRRHCLATGHMADNLPQPVSEDKCPRCERVFTSKGTLDKHMTKCKATRAFPVLVVQNKIVASVQNNNNKDDDDHQGGAIDNGPQEDK